MRKLVAVMVALAALVPALAFAQGAAPDSSWAGVLAPVVEKWFPQLSHQLVLLILGLVISVVHRLVRDQVSGPGTPATGPDKPGPNPVHVAIPAAAGLLLAGIPGLVIGAAGDGVRRAIWAVAHWVGARFKHSE